MSNSSRKSHRSEPRFKEIVLTPGPGDYNNTIALNRSPSALITKAKKKDVFGSKPIPGPSCYNPHPLLQKTKKVTIRLPPRVRIDLTPGVGAYNSSPQLKNSPRAVISRAKKISSFTD